MSIDPRAVVDPSAKLADDVTIGPFTVIGPHVEIDAGSKIGPHVVINGPTRIGRDNRIFQFASIGEEPQDKKYHGEASLLEIGDRNTIREFSTINRGTEDGGGITRLGNDNWIMAYIHIAHDCLIGNNITMANGASLAGHVTIDDYAILGGFTLVHQFCAIGQNAFCGMGSAISKDIPPYIMVSGNPAQPYGLNIEGLKRRGFDSDVVRSLKEAYKVIYRSGLTIDDAKTRLRELAETTPEIEALITFLEQSSRGILR
jgi:UDP-N-acetylglucosamine acyltransferase